MSKCIITGGAGFIGSNLVKDLAGNGHQIIVVDNMYTGSKELLNSRSKLFSEGWHLSVYRNHTH
ncbi:MAG: NAD-dependent epimerase/dehydratase family protein, partial [Nitrososphaeria archaeon]